jgi:hypothetical protein
MAETKTRKISNKVVFVNYRDKKDRGRDIGPGQELDVSTLADGEEQRLENAGAFADSPLALERRGSDMDGHTFVDDREPDDAETPVPPENGGVRPLDDEESDYSDSKTYSKSDLEDLAQSRGLEVEGTGANGAVTRKDLEQALVDDDNAA